MDDMKSKGGSAYERSDEEVSWDAEFANMDERRSGYASMLGDAAKLIVQVPVALVRMPMEMLPDETARHTRAAAREGFLAVRSLLGRWPTASRTCWPSLRARRLRWQALQAHGAQGGMAPRQGNSSTPPGKARRIEVSDEVSERSGARAAPASP